MSSTEIKKQVDEYYSGKLKAFGATPQGVDWNGEASQQLRFNQLLKIIDPPEKSFSLLDYGCGFGSMFEFMKMHYHDFKFTGYDIAETMIEEAKKKYDSEAEWLTVLKPGLKFDYVTASGIFNVRLQNLEDKWLNYILDTINDFNNYAVKGFSFNVLTKYSDAPYMKDYLYYADPLFLFDYCKKNFSKHVALLHDYQLYEFTLLIRKTV
ncbi:MAG: class I SAM-dependent methyltransferase [Bacteroidia bacterium]